MCAVANLGFKKSKPDFFPYFCTTFAWLCTPCNNSKSHFAENSIVAIWQCIAIATTISQPTNQRASRLIYDICFKRQKLCHKSALWNDALHCYRCHSSTRTPSHTPLLSATFIYWAHIDTEPKPEVIIVLCTFIFLCDSFSSSAMPPRAFVHGQCSMRCSAPNRFIWFVVCNFWFGALLPQRIKINNARM